MTAFANWEKSWADVPLVDYYSRVPSPRHEDAVTLLNYWRGCVADHGALRIGKDIPARTIARLLSSIVVHEPLEGCSDTRIWLAGADTRRRFHKDLKGERLSQLFESDDFAAHIRTCRDVLMTGEPAVVDTSLRRGHIEELHAEVLVLPALAPDGKTLWLLVGMFFFELPQNSASR